MSMSVAIRNISNEVTRVIRNPATFCYSYNNTIDDKKTVVPVRKILTIRKVQTWIMISGSFSEIKSSTNSMLSLVLIWAWASHLHDINSSRMSRETSCLKLVNYG